MAGKEKATLLKSGELIERLWREADKHRAAAGRDWRGAPDLPVDANLLEPGDIHAALAARDLSADKYDSMRHGLRTLDRQLRKRRAHPEQYPGERFAGDVPGAIAWGARSDSRADTCAKVDPKQIRRMTLHDD